MAGGHLAAATKTKQKSTFFWPQPHAATQQSRIQKHKGSVASRQRRLVATICSRPPSKANSAQPARVRHEQPEQPEHSQIHTTPSARSTRTSRTTNNRRAGGSRTPRFCSACSCKKSHVVSGTAPRPAIAAITRGRSIGSKKARTGRVHCRRRFEMRSGRNLALFITSKGRRVGGALLLHGGRGALFKGENNI